MELRMILLEYFYLTGIVLGGPVAFHATNHLELPGKISWKFLLGLALKAWFSG
jgi:hypothetical protein